MKEKIKKAVQYSKDQILNDNSGEFDSIKEDVAKSKDDIVTILVLE